MSDRRHAFVLGNSRLQNVWLTPEIRLYLADEVMPVWERLSEELDEKDVAPPLWAFPWVGGQAVARYVLDRPEKVEGKRVIDFAAGSGLCGIAAMKAGAASALAADVDPFCAEVVAMNAEANGVQVAYTDRDLLDYGPPEADLILAGDVCYEQPMAGRVLDWLREAHTRGTRVLVGDPGRSYFPADEFTKLAAYEVRTMRGLEDREIKRVGVYTHRRPLA